LPLVRLSGPQTARKAGIAVELVQTAAVPSVIMANGEVSYDQTRLARVRPRVSGIAAELRGNVGDAVRQGDVLAVIDSAELGDAKADYLAAVPMVELWTQALARNRGLGERGIVAEKQILEAETELRRVKAEALKARQRLRNLGLSGEQIARLAEEDEDERNRLEITAPLSGTVVRRGAVSGEAVEPTTELFTIADVSRVWMHLDVYEKDLRRIRIGQPVIFRVPGMPAAEFTGAVTWIDTEVNDQARTIRVRAEVANPDGLLRANMFGKGEIQTGDADSSLVVPRDAVQWEGSSFVVFVQKTTDGQQTSADYEPRRVLLGREGNGLAELAWADLQPGALVVTTGSFLLKTEIQKGAIGAGCCAE
jgi:cobalt-zinc-cadmium efflux system membrane fusion protein